MAMTPSYSCGPLILWHQSFWSFLHTTCLWADRRPKSLSMDCPLLARGLAEAIPCPSCKAEWLAVISEVPCEGREMFPWSVDVHNTINKRLGKTQVTFEEALARWAAA